MLTDEQYSRVLGEHDIKKLASGGNAQHPGFQCVYQAALVEEGNDFIGDFGKVRAECVEWFDGNYHDVWTVDELLTEIQTHGI